MARGADDRAVQQSRSRMSPDAIAALLQTWGYPLWILLFLASGVGSPITEDVLLLAGGWLLALGVFSWPVALPLGYVAVVATDSIIYSVGRHLREQTKRGGWLRRAVRPGHLRVATRWFSKYGNWIIFIARLTPGTRLIVYISAGVRGVPLSRFLFYDGLASLIYVPVTLYIGEQLGARIGDLGAALAWAGGHIQWLLVVVIVGLGVRHWWRRRLQHLR